MSFDSSSHFSEDVLERYSLNMLSEQGCADVEEHLLLCPRCQTQLEQVDKYNRVLRSACVLMGSRSQGIPKARGMQLADSL
jgi:protein-arginine kinase activator protein McsA